MPKDVVADVEPLDVTGTRSVVIGTAAWVVALVVLLPFTGTLRDDGNGNWLWTCVAGIALGAFGIWYCRRRAAHFQTDRTDRTAREQGDADADTRGLSE